jgi:alanine racemase
MENKHVTRLEIDLDAVNFNLGYLKSFLNDSTDFLAVVKAFGYGSEALGMARHLEPRVDYLAVAYTDEGLFLRQHGIKAPILVLHPQQDRLTDLIESALEPNIYSMRLLRKWIALGQEEGRKLPRTHIKLNTGLNRLGFASSEIAELGRVLTEQDSFKVHSVFSHIAASEDRNEEAFTQTQINRFESGYAALVDLLGYRPMRHLLNTSGIVNFAEQAQYDMVRSGIGLYGFGNDPAVTAKLKPALSLKTQISQMHEIPPGESVGYNRAFYADRPTRIATLPIGHADGISRRLGQGVGYAYINGNRVPYVGNVCMDMLMVDVTDVSCKEGDEVIIYKDQEHVEELAAAIGTISYELLTAISQRVKRKFISQ